MPDLNIRAARMSDIEDVLTLWTLAESSPSISDSHHGIQSLLEHDPEALLVAELEGQLIGSLIAAWDGWRGSFYRLAVHPAHRRVGIASALLGAGEHRLRKLGAQRLTAIVIGSEHQATGFWSELGYEPQSDRARFIKQQLPR